MQVLILGISSSIILVQLGFSMFQLGCSLGLDSFLAAGSEDITSNSSTFSGG